MSSGVSTTAPCFRFQLAYEQRRVGGGWTSDPVRLTEQDGMLFGRGSGDAKGSIVATAEAGLLLRRTATYGQARWS
jgi:acetylornithine deacetylase/succinyl-diaminopimelate desuccinylase-like protein